MKMFFAYDDGTVEGYLSRLKSFLLTPVYKDYTNLHLVIAIAALLSVFWLTRKILLKRKDQQVYRQFDASCSRCGWQAVVRHELKVCPQCHGQSLKHKRYTK
mgnify:CR=1 FL=1